MSKLKIVNLRKLLTRGLFFIKILPVAIWDVLKNQKKLRVRFQVDIKLEFFERKILWFDIPDLIPMSREVWLPDRPEKGIRYVDKLSNGNWECIPSLISYLVDKDRWLASTSKSYIVRSETELFSLLDELEALGWSLDLAMPVFRKLTVARILANSKLPQEETESMIEELKKVAA